MEKKIKVRKKRFAAFWIAALVLCGMIVPRAVNAVDENGVLTDSDTLLFPNTSIKAKVVIYLDVDGSELGRYTQGSGGAQTIAEYSSFNEIPEEYQFEGWSVVEKGEKTENSGEEYGNVTYHTSVTLKANLKLKEFKITFNTDGGNAIGPIIAVPGAAIIAPDSPEKTGYSFAGWDKEIPSTMPAEDLTITARWTVNQYTITFDTVGGSAVDAITADYGASVTAPADPTREGYTFDGWDQEIPATMPAENITITAQWTANKHTIKFVNEGGTELQSSEVSYDEMPVYTGATPTKAATAEHSYSFAGWDPEITAVTGDATYTATYTETVNQYTITFDTAGGSSVDPITKAYGTDITAPEDPTREGYTFYGWDSEIPATMPAENMTITARWNVNQYTITFDTDGGSEIASITQDYGSTVTAPANPTREGYTFAGWDKAIPATMPAENITITARWTANSYSIRYILNGGTNGDNPGSYTYGTGVSGFANAVKPGYNFVGWYESADFSGNSVTSVAANRTGDITLYAKFEMGTIEAGTYSLTAGVAYKLGNVTKVSGDNSVYTAGSIFYVPTSGTYTFS